MIKYTLRAICDGCKTEIASATVNIRSLMDVQIYDWRNQWWEQGFKLDESRRHVVYCAICTSKDHKQK